MINAEAFEAKEYYYFFSHSHSDSSNEMFEQITSAIVQQYGARRCFISSKMITSNWQKETAQSIVNASIFVLFVSDKSLESVEVTREVSCRLKAHGTERFYVFSLDGTLHTDPRFIGMGLAACSVYSRQNIGADKFLTLLIEIPRRLAFQGQVQRIIKSHLLYYDNKNLVDLYRENDGFEDSLLLSSQLAINKNLRPLLLYMYAPLQKMLLDDERFEYVGVVRNLLEELSHYNTQSFDYPLDYVSLLSFFSVVTNSYFSSMLIVSNAGLSSNELDDLRAIGQAVRLDPKCVTESEICEKLYADYVNKKNELLRAEDFANKDYCENEKKCTLEVKSLTVLYASERLRLIENVAKSISLQDSILHRMASDDYRLIFRRIANRRNALYRQLMRDSTRMMYDLELNHALKDKVSLFFYLFFLCSMVSLLLSYSILPDYRFTFGLIIVSVLFSAAITPVMFLILNHIPRSLKYFTFYGRLEKIKRISASNLFMNKTAGAEKLKYREIFERAQKFRAELVSHYKYQRQESLFWGGQKISKYQDKICVLQNELNLSREKLLGEISSLDERYLSQLAVLTRTFISLRSYNDCIASFLVNVRHLRPAMEISYADIRCLFLLTVDDFDGYEKLPQDLLTIVNMVIDMDRKI